MSAVGTPGKTRNASLSKKGKRVTSSTVTVLEVTTLPLSLRFRRARLSLPLAYCKVHVGLGTPGKCGSDVSQNTCVEKMPFNV